MNLRNGIFIVIILGFILGCSSDTKKQQHPTIDPDESALPHGKALPVQALSKADIAELKNAKGKKAITISMQKLDQLIQSSDRQLHCFVFWKSDCTICQPIVQKLEKEALERQNIKIILVTNEPDKDALDLFIRQKNIVPVVYQIKGKNGWEKMIDKNWSGQFPAILLVNKAEKLKQFYPIKSLNEFEALITPLLP